MRINGSALFYTLFAVSQALAQADSRVVSLPPQSLAVLIHIPAGQSDLNVLVDPALTSDRWGSSIKVSDTTDQVLAELVTNTDLAVKLVNARTTTVVPSPESRINEHTSTIDQSPTKSTAPNSAHSSTAREQSANGAIPEVLVRGAKTLNTDIARTEDDILPYVVFDRNDITNSGAVNLEDFFKQRLSMNASSVSANQLSDAGNRSSINLRGLGSDETLILIDGRRVAGFGIDGSLAQPNINNIPLAAIERIEVLPTTASGIYGGGATGGVVNIVLRRDYSGIEAKLGYGNTFKSDAASRHVDISAGFDLGNGKTNLLIAGSYADANPLLARERDLTNRGRQHILINNPSYFYSSFEPPLGETTNIKGIDPNTFIPVNLTLDNGTPLNSPITYIPSGYAGTLTDGGEALIENAGQYNLALPKTAQNEGGAQGLLSSPEVKSLMMTLRHDISARTQVFAEVYTADSKTEFAFNPANFSANANAIIPADAPNNPFQQAIFVTVPAVGLDSEITSRSEDRRGVVGVIMQLPKEWTAGFDFTWNRTRSSYETPGGITADTRDAISNGSIDVLRDLNQFPLNFRAYREPLLASSPADAVLRSSSLRAAGPLPWSLPAGDIHLSTLIERRNESLNDVVLTRESERFLIPSRSQSVNSIYLEATAPLLAKSHSTFGAQLLEFRLAVRFDQYRVTGASGNIGIDDPAAITRLTSKDSSIDPTIGFRYQVADSFALRASYGTGYLPPSMSQLVPNAPISFTPRNLRDPLRGNEQLGRVEFISGGNPALRAEKSETWSAGLIFTPQQMPALRFALDWSRIEKRDNIAPLGLTMQARLNEAIELFPERVIRNTPSMGESVGAIIGLDNTLINIASLKVEALDISFDYEVAMPRFGEITAALSGTHLLRSDAQSTPSAPIIDNVGVLAVTPNSSGGLRWRANASIGWRYRGWNLGWRTHFFDSYFLNTSHIVDANQGSATVPSQIYHDVFGAYQLKPSSAYSSGLLANMEVQFGVNNVFGKAPPIDVGTLSFINGYSSVLGDPRLANYYFSLRKSFGGGH